MGLFQQQCDKQSVVRHSSANYGLIYRTLSQENSLNLINELLFQSVNIRLVWCQVGPRLLRQNTSRWLYQIKCLPLKFLNIFTKPSGLVALRLFPTTSPFCSYFWVTQSLFLPFLATRAVVCCGLESCLAVWRQGTTSPVASDKHNQKEGLSLLVFSTVKLSCLDFGFWKIGRRQGLILGPVPSNPRSSTESYISRLCTCMYCNVIGSSIHDDSL